MKRLQNIKFIRDDEQNGVLYDWDLVYRDYKSLGCPDDVFDPTTTPIKKVQFVFDLSTRSLGKTTNWLLIGMILNARYGTTICYVRNTEEETAPKYSRELMNVIVSTDNGRYIKQITDGRFNHVKYDARRLYYCLLDDNGKEVDRATEPFLIMLSLDKTQEYKSTLNVYRGDFFIFDEFVRTYYRDGSFIDFMQLFSTVNRWREGSKIIMLANTIRYTSQWYREFCVQSYLKRMKLGEKQLITTPENEFTPGGTKIWIELVEPKAKPRILKQASLFYGFANPDLLSIIGTDIAWSLPYVPRIKYEEDDVIVTKKLRIAAEDELKLVIVFNHEVGLHANVYPATSRRKDDEYLLTLEEPRSRKDLYALGSGDVFRRIWDLYKRNLFYYSDNETGAILMDYVQRAKDALRKRI